MNSVTVFPDSHSAFVTLSPQEKGICFPSRDTPQVPSPTSHPNIFQEKEGSFSSKHNLGSDNLAGCRGIPRMEGKAQNRYPGRKGEMATRNLKMADSPIARVSHVNFWSLP